MLDIADGLKRAFDLGVAANLSAIKAEDGSTAIPLPEGYQLATIPPLEKPLTRIRARAELTDAASFVEYLRLFKQPGSRIFAQTRAAGAAAASFRAIIDYHKGEGTPDHCAHAAGYAPRYSEQWKRWTAAQAKPMSQMEFAEFIEENRVDIVEPEAATLFDIVRKFKASKKIDYDSVTYQPDGSVMVAYSDKVEAAGRGIAVPERITLGIPVFFKGPPYAVGVLMRYKVGEGAVAFSLKIDRADYIEQDAFDVIAKDVSAATEIPIYMGSVS